MAHADPGGRAWRELRTERFILVTDLDEDAARDRARELEERGAAVTELYGFLTPRKTAPVRPVRLIHLARCEELRRISGREAVGFVAGSVEFGYERLAATCEGDPFASETAVHELSHDLNHRFFSDLPVWLEEGLATFHQTLALENDKIVVGRPPRVDASYWIAVAGFSPLQELLAMPHQQFYGLGGRRGYFAAWKLTHLLINGSPDYARRFRRFLTGLGSGENREAAFTTAFGDVMAQLAGDYRTYHRQRVINVRQLPYRRKAASVKEQRRLRPGEVHALWIDLSFVRRDRAAILEHLARLERDDPDWSRRLYWRALVQDRLQIPGEPVLDLLRQYVTREPDDGDGWLALVQVGLLRLLPTGHIGIEPAPPPRLEEMEDDVRGLVRIAATPAQLDTVGWYYALRRRPAIGLNFTLRALAAEPGCASCWDTLALLYFRAGRVREAVAAQDRAAGLMAENGLSLAVRARLDHYRRAASGLATPPAGR